MRALLGTTFLLLVLGAAAPGQVGVPRVGCFVDGERRLRMVYGVAGTFVIGEPERDGVESASCAGPLTIVKTETALEVNGTLYAAPEGPARIRRDGYVEYLSSGEWVRATARSLESAAAPEPLPSEAAIDGDGIRIGETRIELGGRPLFLHELGPGWVRVVLEDGTHLAIGIATHRAYRLPEISK